MKIILNQSSLLMKMDKVRITEILLEYYGAYLTKLDLQKYIATDKEIEFVFSVY